MNLEHVVLAPDKFRGSISAKRFADGLATHLETSGIAARSFPLSDGGEGFLSAFEGTKLDVELSGPLGEPVRARALLQPTPTGLLGIVESAEAIGRHLVVDPTPEIALAASSRPLGELLLACINAGATELLVGLGGSATTDGGRGVFDVLRQHRGLAVPMTIACDVDVAFLGALDFAAQKGIAPDDLPQVAKQLHDTAAHFHATTGIDPTLTAGAGAAGGVAGALFCLGGALASGAELVVEKSGLGVALDTATVLITGEGALDATSLRGKVVGHLLASTPPTCVLIIIAGTADTQTMNDIAQLRPGTHIVVLDRVVGLDAALRKPLAVASSLLDKLLFAPRAI